VRDLGSLTVYLDSNVLFSASYITSSRFQNFWRLAGVAPVTSPYAVTEVRRHIKLSAQSVRFDKLIAATKMVSDSDSGFVPESIQLAEKDRPILAAAIAASVDYLITGDKSHLAHLYGSRVSGVRIISPSEFLGLYEDRLHP
jgi:predicted nucleic acid-binding protein